MKSRWQSPVVLFLICSIFLHILASLSLYFSPPPKPPPDRDKIEVILREDAPKSLAKQIVAQEKSINNEIDDKAKFLSAFNQKVSKQTRALQTGKFQNTASSGSPQTAPHQAQPKQREVEQPKRSTQPLDLATVTPQFKVRPPSDAQGGNDNSPLPASQTDDYIKDIEPGMQTMLSAREFVYYSYYARIKERIKQHWEPNIREKVKMIFKTGRTIASTKDHITQVVITLNKAGELQNIEVITPSGIQQLDQAAVEAFRAAQPFPNPPKGLVEDDGQIRIRWDFVLEAKNGLPHLNGQYALRKDP